MFASFTWRDRLSSLLMRGCEIDAITHTTDDDNVESAIQLFQFSAEKDPTFLLKETMAMSGSIMAPLSIAMLYACAPDEFLKDSDNRFFFTIGFGNLGFFCCRLFGHSVGPL